MTARHDRDGTLDAGGLAVAIGQVRTRRDTGRLHVRGAAGSLSFRFVVGEVSSATSSDTQWRLGEWLVERGELSRADLERALPSVCGGRRLGAVLRELGLWTATDLAHAIAEHVEQMLLHALSWTRGSWSFDVDAPDCTPGEDLDLGLTTARVTRRVVGRIPRHHLDALHGDRQRVLSVSDEGLRGLELSSSESFLISRVDGAMSVEEVLETMPGEREGVERSLLWLICLGALTGLGASQRRLAAEQQLRRELLAAHAALGSVPPTQTLGVPADATAGQIRSAYTRLIKAYHPDILPPGLSDLKPLAGMLIGAVQKAYETLVARRTADAALPPVPAPATNRGGAGAAAPIGSPWDANGMGGGVHSDRELADPLVAVQRVDEALRASRSQFDGGRFWDAILVLEKALPLAVGRQSERVRVLLARCYSKNPRWGKRAEEELLSVLRDFPDSPDAPYELGLVYSQAGLKRRAVSSFRRALAIDAGHRGAAAELAALEPPARPRVVERLFALA